MDFISPDVTHTVKASKSDIILKFMLIRMKIAGLD